MARKMSRLTKKDMHDQKSQPKRLREAQQHPIRELGNRDESFTSAHPLRHTAPRPPGWSPA